ncbi:MAG: ComF family protein [Catalinimonas sp.]
MIPMRAIRSTLAAYGRGLVGLLYPEQCAGCDAALLSGERIICTECRSRLPQTRSHVTPVEAIERRFWGRVPLRSVDAFFYFRKEGRVQHLMHQYKYKGRREIGTELGRWYGDVLREGKAATGDVMVPVPLHPTRERTRGYNQSEVFGRAVSEALSVPLLTDVLLRTQNRSSQTRRGRLERWQNAEATYEVRNAAAIEGRHVVLIDDIITTGATLEACAQVLLERGKPASISVLCIAATE